MKFSKIAGVLGSFSIVWEAQAASMNPQPLDQADRLQNITGGAVNALKVVRMNVDTAPAGLVGCRLGGNVEESFTAMGSKGSGNAVVDFHFFLHENTLAQD